jgi:hypothetical protein
MKLELSFCLSLAFFLPLGALQFPFNIAECNEITIEAVVISWKFFSCNARHFPDIDEL